ncbi:hypothetical protein [Pseudidiomarina sp.]|uniref:hypothetical protein n=1 Tax=Pseudidiomarina sp. TaxID=2081707 RepID=UPI00299E2E93|nr:hypothetical protein [Pseudidiomarina sp.]MDX1705480.1 hypothetical protein [Pseudidiomarina sp.]
MRISAKKRLITAVTALVIGLLLIWLFQLWQQGSAVKNRNQLYQELLERSGVLNRDLPKLLDEHTRFERAEVANYGMRFVYSLIGIDKYRNDVAGIQAQVEGPMQHHFCNSESLAFYRNHADFVEFRYLDMNDASLFTLRFTPADCIE